MTKFLRSNCLFSTFFMAAALLAGCAGPQPTAPTPVSLSKLAAYLTQTIPVKPTSTLTATEPPISAPSPSSYSIQKEDTLLEIARRFGVSLPELLTANPGILPEALSVGQVIQIPARGAPNSPSPSAAADLGETVCYPSGGGLYCFVLVSYSGQGRLENIKAQVNLFDAEGQIVASGEALPPLTGLGAGQMLPAVIFFPRVGTFNTVQAQLLTAIQTDAVCCLPVKLENLLVSIAWGGLSARVEGQVRLAMNSKPVRVVWLAGVAYDAHEQVVGVRRWEWSGALPPGESVHFWFSVYSAGPPIARVEVWAEARP